MPTPPPRKRFQIHLPTAIVMMFVAGALIWANTARRAAPARRTAFVSFRTGYGWPRMFWKSSEAVPMGGNQFIGDDGIQFDLPPEYFYWNALIDFLLFPVVLFAVWFLLEWLILRRSAQKSP